MQLLELGELKIRTIVEQPPMEFMRNFAFPSLSVEQIIEYREWIAPRFYDPGKDVFLMAMQSYLIQTPHHTILFDTCCGNHKDRKGFEQAHMLDTPYLENLASAGVNPEDIDFVMCSHFHADHVGWNTRLLNGRWIPTFPNAKYLICKREYEYWEAASRNGNESSFQLAAYNDSIVPVISAGQAIIVDEQKAVDGVISDEFRLFPLPGHTEGHCGLSMASAGRRAIMTGDAIHSPIQIVHPEYPVAIEDDAEAAYQSRRKIVDTCRDADVVLLTAHFPDPTAGRVVSRAGKAHFQFIL